MRCIKPLAPSRNETNSSRVNVGADGVAILGNMRADGGHDQAGFSAGSVFGPPTILAQAAEVIE
jgi:hypothetical protein